MTGYQVMNLFLPVSQVKEKSFKGIQLNIANFGPFSQGRVAAQPWK
jgi:hypothetical protein